jgi:hypothetical protein
MFENAARWETLIDAFATTVVLRAGQAPPYSHDVTGRQVLAGVAPQAAQRRGGQPAGPQGPMTAGGQPPGLGPHGTPIGGQCTGPHETGWACAGFTTIVLSTSGAA